MSNGNTDKQPPECRALPRKMECPNLKETGGGMSGERWMPELRQLERQVRDARDSLAFAIANFGRISTEAHAARKHLTEQESRLTCELQAVTLD